MRVLAIIGAVGLAGLGGWYGPDLYAALNGSGSAASTPATRERERAAIERILRHDIDLNDGSDGQQVVAAMQAVQRGDSPEDFWTAYQAHVRSAEVSLRLGAHPTQEKRTAANAEYWRTYQAVLDTARRHGVDTSEGEETIARNAR